MPSAHDDHEPTIAAGAVMAVLCTSIHSRKDLSIALHPCWKDLHTMHFWLGLADLSTDRAVCQFGGVRSKLETRSWAYAQCQPMKLGARTLARCTFASSVTCHSREEGGYRVL